MPELVCRTLIPVLLLILAGRAAASDRSAPDFAREVRPVLSHHCFQCHGPDDDTREADLRLDTQEGVTSVLDEDDPAASEILARIVSDDPDLMMPPPDANKALSASQIQLLQQWVETGADWQQHWAFTRPQKSPVPADASGWARNEIDAFALQRMQAIGLSPSPEADPYTLLRRVYLDLTGLPPTPEEADHWARRIWPNVDWSVPGSHRAATDETQWQELITTLVSSPAWAERWARRWLDLARYADTNGYEKDRERSIWPWRDWVINALHEGMPFDQFTIEQIAGDMLPNATQQQRVATGFHRNTMLNEEGGIDPLEFRFHAMTDRVATTATTWLGLTLGCAQCHTHKYDPISHREYYQFMALLNNADEPTLRLTSSETMADDADRLRQADELVQKLADSWPAPDSFAPVPSALENVAADSGAEAVVSEGHVRIASTAAVAEYDVRLQVFDDCDQLVLQGITEDDREGPGNTDHGNFVITGVEVSVAAGDGTWRPVSITSAQASVEQPGFEVGGAIDDDPKSGWAVDAPDGPVAKEPQAVFRLAERLAGSQESPVTLQVRLHQNFGSAHTLRSFRLLAAQRETRDREQDLTDAFEVWLKTQRSTAVAWRTVTPVSARSSLPILEIEADGAVFASGDTAKRDDYWISIPASAEPVTALRLEALPDGRLPAGGPGTTYYEGTFGDFFLNEITVSAAGAKIPVGTASHSFANDRYGRPSSAQLTIDGDVQTGWSVHERQGERHTAVFVFESPIPANTPFEVHMVFGRHFASSLGRFRFSVTSSDRTPEAHQRADHVDRLLLQAPDALSDSERQQLRTAFLLEAPELKEQQQRIRELQKPGMLTTSLVMQERPEGHPRPTWRHHRGEFLQPKERVEPGILSILQPLPDGTTADRLALAEWLVSAENPLTSRVVVNRHWEAIFGTGIVRTAEDFGLQGEFPTHRELLDWLAVTLVEDDGWSLRQLHRRIVSSSLYRQASAVNAQATIIDPDNRFLSYAPRFRLDAEVVRDRLLVAAGVLNRQVGGPSVRPPQPGGASEGAYRGGAWKPSKGADRYRRSLYTFARRTAPFAMLTTFDAPSGEACIARRNRSNNPLQALTLLNDVMFTDLARHAGRRVAAHKGSDTDRVTLLFRRVLVRPPTDSELASMLAWVGRMRESYASRPEQARELAGLAEGETTEIDPLNLAVWTGTARALFALDETVMRE